MTSRGENKIGAADQKRFGDFVKRDQKRNADDHKKAKETNMVVQPEFYLRPIQDLGLEPKDLPKYLDYFFEQNPEVMPKDYKRFHPKDSKSQLAEEQLQQAAEQQAETPKPFDLNDMD